MLPTTVTGNGFARASRSITCSRYSRRALLIASIFPNGIRVDDAVTWVLATLVVWIVTALGTWLLPLVFLKRRAGDRASSV